VIFAKSRRERLFDGGFLLKVAVPRLTLHNLRESINLRLDR
jgi:hypothetical protein